MHHAFFNAIVNIGPHPKRLVKKALFKFLDFV